MWIDRDKLVSSPSRCPGMKADDAVFALLSSTATGRMLSQKGEGRAGKLRSSRLRCCILHTLDG